jgi:hypothetical protein
MSSGQKWIICIVIALLCFLPSSKSVTNKVNLSAEETEAYGFAGLFSYMSVAIAVPDDKPKPVADCKCNKGTGKISYDGGGSLTDCPCKDGTCDCGCVNSKKKGSGEAVGASQTVQIKKKGKRTILVTDPINCQPCRQVDSGLLSILRNKQHQSVGWVINNTEDATLQVLNINDPKDVAEIERLGLDFTVVPTFIRYNSEGESISGNISYEEFLRFSEGGNKRPFYKSRTKSKWHINGNYSPSKQTIINHLRTNKDHAAIAQWPLEILSQEDLRSLHSDVHNKNYGLIEWRDK